MRKPLVAAVLAVSVLGGSGCAAGASSAGRASAPLLPTTKITVNASGRGRPYDGIGAVLGGGGNARYLMDYPEPERSQILDYLFKPEFGATLQVLKLEIGGGADSTDGAEPSIEPARGHINCNAGYEFAIAKLAVKLNPGLKLYGLQWSAPGWVGNSAFTAADRQYLLDWLRCARKNGLTITYLGGWNEDDDGSHAQWWAALRSELNKSPYKRVQLVGGDSRWTYSDPNNRTIGILGAHDICGYPTGDTPDAECTGPPLPPKGPGWQKTVWASELGGEDSGAQAGCVSPCAQGMVRALVRGYHDARLTGYIEWPVLDAMPPGLPLENRGLVSADQPWSGNYRVNALTWATAQFTQFAFPKTPGHPGWRYVDSGTGILQRNRADGSYVTLVRNDGRAWSTIIETTGASKAQNATFKVTGGVSWLASDTVHVWASDFNVADKKHDVPSNWFRRRSNLTPVNGKFTITLQPGWVYSLTTTTGEHKGTTSAVPPASDFTMPYDSSSDLAGTGPAGRFDDEPPYLAAQDGSFELEPCAAAFRGNRTCTEQMTRATPVFWHGAKTQAARYPYAVIGNDSLRDYTVSVEALLTQADTSAGLIGRFSGRGFHAGYFDGYVFDVSTTGGWLLIKNDSDGSPTTLVSGTLGNELSLRTWHLLSMSLSGNTITVSVDRDKVASYTDAAAPWARGPAGLEAGAFTRTWPQAQYSNLSITS